MSSRVSGQSAVKQSFCQRHENAIGIALIIALVAAAVLIKGNLSEFERLTVGYSAGSALLMGVGLYFSRQSGNKHLKITLFATALLVLAGGLIAYADLDMWGKLGIGGGALALLSIATGLYIHANRPKPYPDRFGDHHSREFLEKIHVQDHEIMQYEPHITEEHSITKETSLRSKMMWFYSRAESSMLALRIKKDGNEGMIVFHLDDTKDGGCFIASTSNEVIDHLQVAICEYPRQLQFYKEGDFFFAKFDKKDQSLHGRLHSLLVHQRNWSGWRCE